MVAFNKKDAQSYAPNTSYTNSITYTEKTNRHPIIGLLDCIPLEFAMPRII